MKRPGLFAVYAILKQLRFLPANYSDLAKSTLGVRDRGMMKEYLGFFAQLRFVHERTLEVPSKSLKGALEHRWVSSTVYEITPQGKAFLELFPRGEEELDALPSILPRPSFLAVQKILEECAQNSEMRITSFSYLCSDDPPIVANRRNCIRYLKLLKKLHWLVLKPDPLGLQRDYYDVTDKGRAFLELLPKVEDQFEKVEP